MTTVANAAEISLADRLEIFELYSRHFYSLDGLFAIVGGQANRNWVDTFTKDGEFSIVRADGNVLTKASGTNELISIYATFLDVKTTRHWINNLVICPEEAGVRGGCYIIAMDIKDFPFRMIRSGLYEDRLVKIGGAWKFQTRKLILDPSSPAA